MTRKIFLQYLWMPALVLAFTLPESANAQFGSARKKEGDAAKEGAKEDGAKAKGTKKKKKSVFGSRNKKKEQEAKDDGKKSEEENAKPTEEDRAKADLEKQLNRQLRRYKDGYFVFGTSEKVFYKDDNGRYFPEEKLTAMVLEGRETTVAFLVDYLSKYPKLTAKELRALRRRSRDEPPPPPTPERDYKFYKWYKEGKEGNLTAHALQEQLQNRFNQSMAAAKKAAAARKRR